MAQFYGSVEGTRGAASRLGTTKSGMAATAAGWRGAISVRVWHDKETNTDRYTVYLTPWEGSEGKSRLLAEGILDASLNEKGAQ